MKKSLVFLIIVAFVAGCITPFPAPKLEGNKQLLVVNGFVDVSKKSARVELTRSVSLSANQEPSAEQGASVVISTDQQPDIKLIESEPGVYVALSSQFNAQQRYQLKIITASGARYSSAQALALRSPEIDSVVWKATPDGVTIYGNATDNFSASKYYFWNFQETWEYTAFYQSTAKFDGSGVVPRGPGDFIYTCWSSAVSSKVLVSTSSRLGKNRISDFVLKFIPKGSLQLSKKYSMLARLRSISEEEYNYWLQVQKTNDNLGGIFDPLPVQVSGNIKNDLDSTEPVIGFFSAGQLSEERIFIRSGELPTSLFISTSGQGCELRFVSPGELVNNLVSYLIVRSSQRPEPPGYFLAEPSCVDCRSRGGSTTRPPFWD
ncbi:MAG: DUF4249 domain-containing protein [Cyclobacteriaceae bacterium]|nr:DUF4249 domain-containing protein [Cyclobacteriaceae bacterium]